MTDPTNAAPEETEPKTGRELEDAARAAAYEANAREYAAPSAPEARIALNAALTALAPIAKDRESIVRVLDALETIFRPVACAPRKDFGDVLSDALEEPVIQALLPQLIQMIGTLGSKPAPTPAPCNCGQRAQRPAPAVVAPPPAPANVQDAVEQLFAVRETEQDLFYVIEGGTAVLRPRVNGLAPPGAATSEHNAKLLRTALLRSGVRTIEVIALA
jgi:hypothetical protein